VVHSPYDIKGYNLPLDRVAAASGHIDALAKAVKRAGDCRPVDHIRADLCLGMTDGTYTGLHDAAISSFSLPLPSRTPTNPTTATATPESTARDPTSVGRTVVRRLVNAGQRRLVPGQPALRWGRG
jgi:hypothetical protein